MSERAIHFIISPLILHHSGEAFFSRNAVTKYQVVFTIIVAIILVAAFFCQP